MPEYLSISEIMQTAVTPVFLLAGIGALLNVMTGRLGRIIDRLRYLQSFLERVNFEDKEIILMNRTRLILRTRFINTSIFFCTLSGLIVCIVIGALFGVAPAMIYICFVCDFFFKCTMWYIYLFIYCTKIIIS